MNYIETVHEQQQQASFHHMRLCRAFALKHQYVDVTVASGSKEEIVF